VRELCECDNRIVISAHDCMDEGEIVTTGIARIERLAWATPKQRWESSGQAILKNNRIVIPAQAGIQSIGFVSSEKHQSFDFVFDG